MRGASDAGMNMLVTERRGSGEGDAHEECEDDSPSSHIHGFRSYASSSLLLFLSVAGESILASLRGAAVFLPIYFK